MKATNFYEINEQYEATGKLTDEQTAWVMQYTAKLEAHAEEVCEACQKSDTLRDAICWDVCGHMRQCNFRGGISDALAESLDTDAVGSVMAERSVQG